MGPGEIVVWGDDTSKQVTSRPPGNDFQKIVPGGATQSLAFRSDGSLTLWGVGDVSLPVLKGNDLPVVDASMGPTHIVIILNKGTITSSGAYPSIVKGGSPVPIPALPAGKGFRAVAVGGGFGVAIDENGKLQTWGSIPAPPQGDFVAVRARNDYAIALDADGRLYGWGGKLFADNTVAAGSKTSRPLSDVYLKDWKRDVNGFLYVTGPFTYMAAGNIQKNATVDIPHVLAIDQNNFVHGWGANNFGECDPPLDVKFRQVAAGHGFSIGLAMDNSLYHWGERFALGTGSDTYVEQKGPGTGNPIFDLHSCPKGRFTSIGAGSHHATAVSSTQWPVQPELDRINSVIR